MCNLLTETEIVLNKIWSSQIDENNIIEDTSFDIGEDELIAVPSTQNEIEKMQLSRAQLKKETDELLERYKFKIEGEKYLLEEKLFKQVDKMTPKFNLFKTAFEHNTGLGNLVTCITNIVIKADELGGFNNNYIPDERVMKGSTCNNIRPYSLPKGINTRYCEQYSFCQMKRVYECVLLKWKIIEPMLFSLLAHIVNAGTLDVFRDMYKIRWYKNKLVLVLYLYDNHNSKNQKAYNNYI